MGIDLGPSLPRPGAPEFSCPRCIIGPSGAKSGAKWELSDGRVTVAVGGGTTEPGHSDSLSGDCTTVVKLVLASFSCTIPQPPFAYHHHVLEKVLMVSLSDRKSRKIHFQKDVSQQTPLLVPGQLWRRCAPHKKPESHDSGLRQVLLLVPLLPRYVPGRGSIC